MSLLRRHSITGEYVAPPAEAIGALRGVASGAALTGLVTYVDDIFSWGGNYMYAFLAFNGGSLAKDQVPTVVASIETRLLYLRTLGMKVIIDLTGSSVYWPGQPGKQTNAFWNYDGVYGTTESIMSDFWKEMATYLSSYDDVVHAFKIHDEPLDETYSGSNPVPPANWHSIAQSITTAVRTVNSNIYIGFQPGPGGTNWAYYDLAPLFDPVSKVLYFVHGYGPLRFTHQGIDPSDPIGYSYPHFLTPTTFEIAYAQTYTGLVYSSAHKDYWDQDTMRYINYKHARDFQLANGNPPMMNVFSAARWAEGTETGAGAAQFMEDTIDLMEEWGWHWVYWLHDAETRGIWGLQYDEGTAAFTPVGETATKTVFGNRAAVLWDGLRLNNYLEITGLVTEIDEDTLITPFTVVCKKSVDDTTNTKLENEVLISIISGPGGLSGTTSRPLVNGVATFDNIQVAIPGAYVLGVSCLGAIGDQQALQVNTIPPAEYAFVGWAADVISAHLAGGESGYTVIKVSNTNPTGTGSLYQALRTAGNRIIVFEAGGVCDWSSINAHGFAGKVDITSGNVYIAGQTAPSPGFHVIKGMLSMVNADNIIAEHFTILGMTTHDSDCVQPQGDRIILNNMSLYYGLDENVGPGPYDGIRLGSNVPQYITVSNCLIADSTYVPGGNIAASKALMDPDKGHYYAFFGNLMTNNYYRNPMMKADVRVAIVNNYIYNPGQNVANHAYVSTEWGGAVPPTSLISVVGNYAQAGPNSIVGIKVYSGSTYAQGMRAQIYMADNIGKLVGGANMTQYGSDPSFLVSSAPVWHSTLNSRVEASALETYIVNNVGARPWNRSAKDTIKINQILTNPRGSVGAVINTSGVSYPSYTPTFQAFNPANWNLNSLPIIEL